MARPKLDPGDRRDETLAVRFTREERRLLDRTAKERGVPVTVFVRDAAVRAAKRAGRK